MNQIQVGIIGAGRIGKVHAQSIANFVPNAVVKAIADPFMTDETKKWAESMGIKDAYTDHKSILEDEEISVVLVCSSTDTHAQMSIEAARAKKHVFCEKPVDHDLDRIAEVLRVVEEEGIKFQVGFNRRFSPDAKRIKIKFKNRNTPLMIYYRVNAGKIPADHWVQDPEVGGGRIIGEVCHFIEPINLV